jgi:hypothetical protein
MTTAPALSGASGKEKLIHDNQFHFQLAKMAANLLTSPEDDA